MKSLHVRLEYTEALESKKQLLSSEMNILEILKRVKNYKMARNRELILKNKVRQKLSALKVDIKNINEDMPEQEFHETEVKINKPKISQKEIQHQENIEFQLEEIKEKLGRLG